MTGDFWWPVNFCAVSRKSLLRQLSCPNRILSLFKVDCSEFSSCCSHAARFFEGERRLQSDFRATLSYRAHFKRTGAVSIIASIPKLGMRGAKVTPRKIRSLCFSPEFSQNRGGSTFTCEPRMHILTFLLTGKFEFQASSLFMAPTLERRPVSQRAKTELLAMKGAQRSIWVRWRLRIAKSGGGQHRFRRDVRISILAQSSRHLIRSKLECV